MPLKPSGPVDAGAALAHVTSMLPALDEQARSALALVELGGRDRGAAAVQLGVDVPTAAGALARGRKALRRSMFPLSAGGWCERAERLLSDRMDGDLPATGAARLDAHLSNCERCQQHDLRLAQALDTLGRTFAVSAPPAAPLLEAPAPELKVVEPPDDVARNAGAETERAAPLGLTAATWAVLFLVAVVLAVAATVVAVLALTGTL